MTKRRLFVLLVGTVLLVASSSARSPAGNGNVNCDSQLPQELRELAAQIGCGPVPGFYDKPGMVDPPYLYGYLPGNKEQSAAFWCYREQGEKPYLLVFVEHLGNGRTGRVTSIIPWHDRPRGLSLNDSKNMPLSEFRYIDNPEERGPDRLTEYAPVVDSYDGVIRLFYQDGKRWLYRILH